jgi:hypothetical protein
MNIYSRVRLDIKRERVEIAATEQSIEAAPAEHTAFEGRRP